MLGHKVRVKTTGQILQELGNIYCTGFRGNVFFVDDNFIGNRYLLKRDLLPAISAWLKKYKYPFTFTTEASINLSDDPGLMEAMAETGFEKVFIGIETPEAASLEECDKQLNLKSYLLESVRTIQSAGIEVSAGFIVGFDSDSGSIFQRQVDFIQKSGIITTMVGLLNAPSRTRLYQRLVGFLKNFKPRAQVKQGLNLMKIRALFRSMILIGILEKGSIYYWRLFVWTLFNRPKLFPMAITYSIYGYHFRKVYGIDK